MEKKILKKLFYDPEYAIWLCLSVGILLLFFILITGCATTQPAPGQSAEAGVVYKYDIHGTVNGVPFDGVGVIPYSDKEYLMRIESRVDVDLLTIQSCHRNKAFESAIELGWFESKKGFEYSMVPDEIENSDPCTVRIGAYNQPDSKQNAWAFLDFESPKTTMPAVNICDGDRQYTGGVSICQSKKGLLQAIKFVSPMKWDANGKCQMTTKDDIYFEYVASANECVVTFMEKNSPYRFHRHNIISYDQILIRGQ